MPNTRKLQLSFGGGEISPDMHSRIDAVQYQSGLAKAQNWLIDPKGPLQKRPGLGRVSSCAYNSKKSRLIPFEYSTDQSQVIELSEETINFYRDGIALRWGLPLYFDPSGVSTTENTITFINDHGLVTGDTIFLLNDITQAGVAISEPPGGLSPIATYEAVVLSSRKIQLNDPATNISTTGTLNAGRLAFYKGSDLTSYMDTDQAGYITGPNWYFMPWSRVNAGQNATKTYESGTKVQFSVTTNQVIAGVLGSEFLFVDRGNDIPGTVIPSGKEHYFILRTSAQAVGTTVNSSNAINRLTLENLVDVNGLEIEVTNLRMARYYLKGEFVRISFTTYVNTALEDFRGRPVRFEESATGYNSGAQTSLAAFQTRFKVLQTDGIFQINSPYQESELEEINYEQTGDIVTLTHPNHAPQELRRYSEKLWTLEDISLSPTIDPPVMGAGVAYRGQAYRITSGTASTNSFIVSGSAPFAVGETVYVRWISNQGSLGDNYYNVRDSFAVEGSEGFFDSQVIRLRFSNGDLVALGSDSVTANVYYASGTAEISHVYKVVSVDKDLQESLPSEEVVIDNVLSVPGASNTISWLYAAGATSYKIYKKKNGIFGFIGRHDPIPGVQGGSFVDDFIGPDLSDTVPLLDEDVSLAVYKPRAVASFEQRRCFGGADNFPRTLFMSRSGTQSSFTYQIPTQSADRISVQMAAKEAHVIRHILSVKDLIVLTQQGEWLVTAINSDALTPETIAVRPQSYIGSSKVRPVVVNNKIVFCANRGGHVREFNYQIESQGYLTGDLSIRANHLFDGFEIKDMSYSKAPTPKLWFVSSNGKLLSLTYVPEEKVLAWHQHVTDGSFESVCAIPEGNFDNVYVTVKRTDSSGATVRSVERLVAVQNESPEDAVYLDASGSYDGSNSSATTVSVTGSSLYKSGDPVTLTFSNIGSISDSLVDDEIEITSDSVKFRIRINAYTSNTVLEGVLLSDLPSNLHNQALEVWAIATKSLRNLDHLSGQTVSVLADGKPHEDVVVAADGSISLNEACVKACVGLKYVCEAETLPVSLQSEAGGQARTKIVNKTYLRVDKSSSLEIGPDSSNLVPVSELGTGVLATGEFETKIPDSWSQDGRVVFRSTDSLPSTVLGLAIQVSVGD